MSNNSHLGPEYAAGLRRAMKNMARDAFEQKNGRPPDNDAELLRWFKNCRPASVARRTRRSKS